MKVTVRTRKGRLADLGVYWEATAENYDAFPDVCCTGTGSTPLEAKASALTMYKNTIESRISETVEEVELDV